MTTKLASLRPIVWRINRRLFSTIHTKKYPPNDDDPYDMAKYKKTMRIQLLKPSAEEENGQQREVKTGTEYDPTKPGTSKPDDNRTLLMKPTARVNPEESMKALRTVIKHQSEKLVLDYVWDEMKTEGSVTDETKLSINDWKELLQARTPEERQTLLKALRTMPPEHSLSDLQEQIQKLRLESSSHAEFSEKMKAIRSSSNPALRTREELAKSGQSSMPVPTMDDILKLERELHGNEADDGKIEKVSSKWSGFVEADSLYNQREIGFLHVEDVVPASHDPREEVLPRVEFAAKTEKRRTMFYMYCAVGSFNLLLLFYSEEDVSPLHRVRERSDGRQFIIDHENNLVWLDELEEPYDPMKGRVDFFHTVNTFRNKSKEERSAAIL